MLHSVAMFLSPNIHIPGDFNTNFLMITRWIHILFGVTWIGLLYFFNLVNVPFQKEMDSPTRAKVVPLMMPRALWWFRWSAVVTVLAGFRYFMILAKTDADNAGVPGLLGRWLGLWFVVWTLAWLAVYLLMKFAKGPLADGRILAVPIALVIAAASWGFLQLIAHPAAGNRTLVIAV